MGKPSDKERVAQWDKRVASASKRHTEWSDEYACNMLEEFYYGKQWQDETSEWAKRKYVINLFYPSVNISKPSLLFNLPNYRITPRPMRMDDPLSDVEARAKLQEQTLNTFVQSPQLGFAEETGLAILDAQFRFGVIQVGYTADFIDNPNVGKPILKDNSDEPLTDSEGKTVGQASVTIKSEGLFFKYIPGKQWIVADNSKNRLTTCDWMGYSEWHHTDDLKRNPRYKNTSSLKATGKLKGEASSEDAGASVDEIKPGMVKVWFLWDLRAKKRVVFPQGGEKFLLEEPFKFLPFAVLKFDERLGEWYPLPPTYNWVHPQNELNDTREMQRIHRKRAIRRYLRRQGAFTPEEWEKLCEGDDMVSAEVNGDPSTSVVPMQDAPLDQAVARNIPQSIDDFIRVSGVSGESQQVADSETATQANLIALQGRVRESAKRIVVAKWLSEIGRIILLTLRENMALPFWIKMAVDMDSPTAPEEAQDVAKLWKQIVNDALGDIDNDISVDLTSLSPVAQAEERTEWLQFLQLVTSPALGMVLSGSPALLRKTAGLFNIHSERDLVEVSKALQITAMAFAQAQADKAGVAMPGAPGPGPTPGNSEIAGQLNEQLPVELGQG